MKKLCTFLVFIALCSTALSQAEDEFHRAVNRAAEKISLAGPHGRPFHLEIEAKDTCRGVQSKRCDSVGEHAEYDTEIEVWWAAADKWRREIKSPTFSQTAIQNGQQYFETNSSDYLPWWLHELITESVTPIPVDELREVNPEWNGKCAKWSSEFRNGNDVATAWSSICINPDGTVSEVLARTASVLLRDYLPFQNKLIAQGMTLWPKGIVELNAKVRLLEPLKADEKLFAVGQDTGINARLRFVTVQETDLRDFKLNTPPLVWPAIHNFPTKGLMTVNVRIGRDGSIREIGSAISINNAVIDAAVDQVRKWRFKPYLVNGSPVEVNTNLVIPFDAELAVPQANGIAYPAIPALERFNKSQQLFDLRGKDGKPFHLTATLRAADASHPAGTYDETWLSETSWKREINVGTYSLVESRFGDRVYRKLEGPADSAGYASMFGLLYWNLPKTDETFHEADWRQTLVKLGDSDSLRIARGEENTGGELTNAIGFWFDPQSSELRQQYRGRATKEGYTGMMIQYGNFVECNGKRFPRNIEITSMKGEKVAEVSVEQLGTTPPRDASFFVVQGVRPEVVPQPRN